MNLPIPTPTLARLNPHLFAPAVRPPLGAGSACEASLHEEIFDECRRRGWIALHGSMAERTHRTRGEPDFVILASPKDWRCPICNRVTPCRNDYPEGCCGEGYEPVPRVIFVECKTRSGKLSPAQAALKHHAEKLGHTVHVVRSREEFLRIASGAN
ncbi:MAG: hypothetical protein WCK57_06360 [Verrucomicrobiae bacterium]